MRTWRVGSLSMGLSLIFLGGFLLLSQFLEWQPAYIMAAWCSIILIVLGIEILTFLFLSKKENPIVKYDLFSIFFVAVVGFFGIGFIGLSATGILDKVQDWTNYEVKTLNLPSYSKDLNNTIKRVVIDGGLDPLNLETGTTDEIAVFGTYRTGLIDGKAPIASVADYLFTEEKGDTLFITIKSPAQKISPLSPGDYYEGNLTVIVPSDIEVELQANHQFVNIFSRDLQNDWTIKDAMKLDVQLESDLDVTIQADHIDHINNKESKWELNEGSANDDTQSGTFQLGKGTHIMNINNTSELFVTTK